MPYDKSNKFRLENSSEINEIIKTVEIGGIASPVGVSKNAVKLFSSTTFILGNSLTLSEDSQAQEATLKGSLYINNNHFSNTVKIAPDTDFLSDMSIKIKEQAAANDDTAAYGQIWVKTATPNELWFTTDAGNDIQLTSGSSLAGGSGDMTGVDLTAGTGISIDSETNTTSGDYSATITCTVTNTDVDVSVANLDARLNELTATSVTVGDATDVTMNFSGGIRIGQGAVFMTEPTVTSGSGMHAWTWSQGNKLDLTLVNGANQITFDTTHPAGGCNVTLKLTQPSSGAAGTVSSWAATGGGYTIKWAGGSAPTLSTASNAIDILSFYFDGATYFGVASLNFS